jgi:signal transduction histidine kinase
VYERIDRRTRRLLLVSFAVIAACVIASSGIGWVVANENRRSIEIIQENALASIELVDRMAIDLQRERILIDRHIFEGEGAAQEMAALEARIAAAKRDFADAAERYAPLATFPGEADTWRRLQTGAAEVDRRAALALALSRGNRDREALAEMRALEPYFDQIERDVAALVAINHAAGASTIEKVDRLQSAQLAIRIGLSIVLLAITFGAGVLLTRRIVRMQRALVAAGRDLEKRNRELDAFAGRVAHDLRGPLGTISMSAAVIAARAPEHADTVSIIDRTVKGIGRLVDDLLELSRTSERLDAVGSMKTVGAAIDRDARPKVEAAGGTLHVELAAARVTCSEELLFAVATNLIDNAIKYRRDDAPLAISIAGRVERAGYVLRVSDNGIGMSADDARSAFEPFFRSERARRLPGTGLGLAIVHRIIAASGGTIALDSALDRGSTFTIALPIVGDE